MEQSAIKVPPGGLGSLPKDENIVDVTKRLFIAKTANEWMDEANLRPIPKQLYGCLWYEGETCILFADTGLGKSIQAVQIADRITKGRGCENFPVEADPQKVLYFDFELSDKQFELRYSNNYSDHYQFENNFIRIEINPDAELPSNQSFEEFLTENMEKLIYESGAKIVIVDNITYLKSENEKSKNALPLMKALKSIKGKYGLSLLILAHTPKRDLSKPITRNDLAGSKMLINFCDSAFAIGESHNDQSIRYIKQIKARNTEIIYSSENVATFAVEKTENYLQFTLGGFFKESEHLKQFSEKDKKKREEVIMQLHEQERSYRDIASEVGCSYQTVRRVIKRNVTVTEL